MFTVSTEVLTPGTSWSFYEEGRSAISVKPNPEKIVRLKFSDTGMGIRKEYMEKIFEPFFTTKPEEKGTGLGLSVSYSIIEKHKGRFEIESTFGVGTTIIIDLPAQKKGSRTL